MKLNKKDLDEVIALAQLSYSSRTMPVCLEGYEVTGSKPEVLTQEQARIVYLIEATITYLGGKELLKEEVRFTYKDNK